MTTTTSGRPSPSAPASSIVSTRNRSPLRKVLVTLHLFLGITLGIVLVVATLTGGALLFRSQIERAAFPTLTHVATSGPVDLDRCQAAANAFDATRRTRQLRMPLAADGTLEWYLGPIAPGARGNNVILYMDPHTCAPLGTRGPQRDWVMNLIFLHHDLFIEGETGHWIQLFTAITAIYLALSGIYLWWPRTWTWSRLRPRSSARPLHYAIGFWAAWPLLFIAFTGAYAAWSHTVDRWVLGEPQPQANAQHQPGHKGADHAETGEHHRDHAAAAPLSLNAALAAAHTAQPDARFRSIRFGDRPGAPLSIAFYLPGENGRDANNNLAVRTAPDGTPTVEKVSVLARSDARHRFLKLLWTIHYGEAFGWLTRIIWMLTALAPPILLVSGILMWRRRVAAEKLSARLRS